MQRYCSVGEISEKELDRISHEFHDANINLGTLVQTHKLGEIFNAVVGTLFEFQDLSSFTKLNLLTGFDHKNVQSMVPSEISFDYPKGWSSRIITDCDDNNLDEHIIIRAKELNSELEEKFPETEKDILKVASQNVLYQSVCFLDICHDLYFSLLYHMNKDSYCELKRFFEEDEEFQKEFSECWRIFHKSIIDYNNRNKKMALPFENKYKLARGKKTQIQNVAPNIFRFLIYSKNYRKLFTNQTDEKFDYKDIKNLFSFEWSNLFQIEDYYLIEKVTGLNLAVKIYHFMRLLTRGVNDSRINNDLRSGIEELIDRVMEWDGIYSRIKFIDIFIRIIKSPDSMWGDDEKIKYIKQKIGECVEIINDTNSNMEFVYRLSREAVLFKVMENGNIPQALEKLKSLLEKDYLRRNMWNKDDSYNLIENEIKVYDRYNDKLYQIIQKRIIKNVMNY